MKSDERVFFHEEETPFSYRPQGVGLWCGRGHGALYYNYHADDRAKRLNTLAQREPELAIAVECVKAMGLFDDCAEMCILRTFRNDFTEKDIRYYRENAPRIALALSGRNEYLKELYFSLILPIVAAIDAGETEIACRIARAGMARLEKEV